MSPTILVIPRTPITSITSTTHCLQPHLMLIGSLTCWDPIMRACLLLSEQTRMGKPIFIRHWFATLQVFKEPKATRVFKKPKPLKAPRPGTTILPLMVTINPPSSLSMGCQIIFSRPMSLSFSPTKGMLFMPSTCVNAGDHTDLANHGITSPVSPNISLTSPR